MENVIENAKKRGRPKKGNVKGNRFSARLATDDVEKIEFIKDKTGESTYELFKKALNIYYNLVKSR